MRHFFKRLFTKKVTNGTHNQTNLKKVQVLEIGEAIAATVTANNKVAVSEENQEIKWVGSLSSKP